MKSLFKDCYNKPWNNINKANYKDVEYVAYDEENYPGVEFLAYDKEYTDDALDNDDNDEYDKKNDGIDLIKKNHC
jgi:hypothetical protein